MIRQARLFFFALQFLTRLPAPRFDPGPDWVARAAPYYPAVGWLVGAIAAAALFGVAQLWPGLPAAVIALAVGFAVTGGFHEDGLADTADGLGGGQTPTRRLEIMKDSRTGTFGALALWTGLTLKAALLAPLAPTKAALCLLAAHGAARAFPVVVMATLRYAGDAEAAKLKPVGIGVRPHEALIALALGLAPLPFLQPLPQAALGVGLATVGAMALALLARRLIGGYTGDVLGAVEQIAEMALLLGFTIGPAIGSWATVRAPLWPAFILQTAAPP